MRHIFLAALFASSAWAQDTTPPPPPPQPAFVPQAIDFMKEAPDENAKQRGKGAMMIALGTVLMPIGITLIGTSSLVWDGYSSTPSCDYYMQNCKDYSPYLAGALTMDILGTLIFAGGATLLAIGTQKYVEHKKPARFAFTGNGVQF